MHVRKLTLLPFLLTCFCLPSLSQNDVDAHSALNGNWHLTGTGVNSIDFTFGVNGNEVYGEGYVGFSCQRGTAPSDIRIDFFVEGLIAEDGSFVLSNRYPPFEMNAIPANVFTIRGNLQASGDEQWPGSFSLSAFTIGAGTAPLECQAGSGNFTATRLPDLRGSYAGTFGLKEIEFGQNAEIEGDVSLEIAQGGLTATRISGRFGHVIGASGKITITGSSEFPSGTYTAIPVAVLQGGNRVYGGNTFELQFIRESGGTELRVRGEVDPKDENRVHIEIIYRSRDGDRKLEYVLGFGWLTRQ